MRPFTKPAPNSIFRSPRKQSPSRPGPSRLDMTTPISARYVPGRRQGGTKLLRSGLALTRSCRHPPTHMRDYLWKSMVDMTKIHNEVKGKDLHPFKK